MECEESFITMKFIWHSYLVLSLGNCAHKISIETGLTLSEKNYRYTKKHIIYKAASCSDWLDNWTYLF